MNITKEQISEWLRSKEIHLPDGLAIDGSDCELVRLVHDCIKDLAPVSEPAKREAGSLAMNLYNQHYKTESSEFELCDSAAGIISQIDNMVSGLCKAPKDEWISVADELPAEGVEVLCYFDHADASGGSTKWHQYFELCVYRDGAWWDDLMEDCNWTPTHWKPTPAPPENKS